MKTTKRAFRKRIFFLLLIFNCLTLSRLFAQLETFSIQQITTKDGLSSSEITCFAQDKSGIVWIGTKDGLNRYDGYSFRVYQNKADDTSSLCDNSITALLVDKQGRLWIGTENNGLSVYQENMDNFRNFHHVPYDINSLSFDYVTSLCEDDGGNIWVGTLMGLNRFDDKEDNFQRLMRSLRVKITPEVYNKELKELPVLIKGKLRPLIGQEIEYKDLLKKIGHPTLDVLEKIFKVAELQNSGAGIRSIVKGNGKNLWIGLENDGILKLDITNFTTKTLKVPKDGNKILSLCSSPDALWIGTMGKGVWKLRFDTEEFSSIKREPESKFVKYIFEDSDRNIWIGDDEGLLKYDLPTGSLKRIYSYFKNKKLLSNDVSAILEDHQGNLWIASYQGGINLLRKGKAFNNFEFHDEKSAENISKTVSAVTEDGKGNIWCGFYISGIDIIKNKGNEIVKLRHNPSDPSSLGFGTVHKIFRDSKNTIWVGSYEGGLQRFDEDKQRFVNVLYDGGKNKIKDVRDICEDNDGNIWFASHGDGIKKYEPETGNITNFRADYTNWETSLSNDWVFSIYCDRKGRIWAGSVAGVSIFNPSTGAFKTYRKLNSNLSHDGVQVITEDYDGHIWLGTPDGLNMFNEKTNSFLVFNINDGLPNNSIKGIESSGQSLWVTTNHGLSKISLPSLKIKNYFNSDGLHSTEFVRNAISKGNTGTILLGGKNGLTTFNPSLITENPFKPSVHITAFKLFNKPVEISNGDKAILTENISKTRVITLPYNQNVLSFEYVGINYIMPEENSYAYKLEGFEANWNYVGHKREATYTNLSAGEYVFKVKACNNDGVWNEHLASIKLIIKPPAWLSTWAIGCYVLFCIIILIVIRREAIHRLKVRGQIKMNEMKLKFFANISHEFRTPLTLITGPLHQLNTYFEAGNEDQKELFTIMQRNGKRLLKLVNQLMNIYEFDAGCMKLQVQQSEIIQFAKSIFEEFQNLAIERNIYYHFASNVSKADCFVDCDKVEKIVGNLLSNSFKYTPDNGSIVTYLTLLEGDHLELVPKNLLKNSAASKFIKISIEDNGKGIPEGFREKIFDRFVRIEDKESAQEGTGLGLYLARQLARIHHGDITLTSELGKGSKFTVWLPVDKKAFKDLEIEPSDSVNKTRQVLQQDLPIEEHEGTELKSDQPIMLLVEDSDDVRNYLKLNFKKNFNIVEAANGQEGIKKAQEIIPDIIISDLMMPMIDGLQLCTILKKDQRTNHIPIILLTARIEESFQLKGLEGAGADDYITKPFNIDILCAKVKNCLEFRETLRKKMQLEFQIKPKKIETPSADDLFLGKLVEIVENNITYPEFDVKLLGKEIGMSQTNLYRKLQSLLGVSGAQFIKNIRLKRAAQLLSAKRYSISEISYMVGFNDPKYFSKSFKKQFGALPSEYQESKEKVTV